MPDVARSMRAVVEAAEKVDWEELMRYVGNDWVEPDPFGLSVLRDALAALEKEGNEHTG